MTGRLGRSGETGEVGDGRVESALRVDQDVELLDAPAASDRQGMPRVRATFDADPLTRAHEKGPDVRRAITEEMVRRVGVEPTCPCGQQSLSLPCIPVPAPPRRSESSPLTRMNARAIPRLAAAKGSLDPPVRLPMTIPT